MRSFGDEEVALACVLYASAMRQHCTDKDGDSKNRLNVAVSRARCLAIVIANPELMAVRCQTPGQMALVNTLCWVAAAGRADDGMAQPQEDPCR